MATSKKKPEPKWLIAKTGIGMHAVNAFELWAAKIEDGDIDPLAAFYAGLRYARSLNKRRR